MTNKNCHTRKIARVDDSSHKIWQILVVPNLPLRTRSKWRPPTLTSAASSRGIYWPDQVMTLLLEAVREKESHWNTKSEAYKNRNVKKVQYEEVLQLIKEELPDVDFVPRL